MDVKETVALDTDFGWQLEYSRGAPSTTDESSAARAHNGVVDCVARKQKSFTQTKQAI
jgi:hypothetical protein